MDDSKLQFEDGRRVNSSAPDGEAFEFEKKEFKKYKTATWELFLASIGEKDVSEVLALVEWGFITDCLVYDYMSHTSDDSERHRAETLGARAYMENELKWSQGKMLQFCAEAYISWMEGAYECLVMDILAERSLSDLRWRLGAERGKNWGRIPVSDSEGLRE